MLLGSLILFLFVEARCFALPNPPRPRPTHTELESGQSLTQSIATPSQHHARPEWTEKGKMKIQEPLLSKSSTMPRVSHETSGSHTNRPSSVTVSSSEGEGMYRNHYRSRGQVVPNKIDLRRKWPTTYTEWVKDKDADATVVSTREKRKYRPLFHSEYPGQPLPKILLNPKKDFSTILQVERGRKSGIKRKARREFQKEHGFLAPFPDHLLTSKEKIAIRKKIKVSGEGSRAAGGGNGASHVVEGEESKDMGSIGDRASKQTLVARPLLDLNQPSEEMMAEGSY